MERVKFYADNEARKQKNKLFTFSIPDALHIGSCLLRFAKKVDYIRAAYYEYINTETGEIDNRKIDLDYFYECLNDKSYDDPSDLIRFIEKPETA